MFTLVEMFLIVEKVQFLFLATVMPADACDEGNCHLTYLLALKFWLAGCGLPGCKSRRVGATGQDLRKGDIVGVSLDLTVPEISFTLNGNRIKGFFRDFNLDGMFYPVVSISAKLRSASAILSHTKRWNGLVAQWLHRPHMYPSALCVVCWPLYGCIDHSCTPCAVVWPLNGSVNHNCTLSSVS